MADDTRLAHPRDPGSGEPPRRVAVPVGRVRIRRRGCTDELALFDHRATITIAEPGTAEIRVIGRQMPGSSTVTAIRELVVED